jgi:hypothetical protein
MPPHLQIRLHPTASCGLGARAASLPSLHAALPDPPGPRLPSARSTRGGRGGAARRHSRLPPPLSPPFFPPAAEGEGGRGRVPPRRLLSPPAGQERRGVGGEEWSGREGESEVGGRQWAEGRGGYRARCIFVCGSVNRPARKNRFIFVCGPVKWADGLVSVPPFFCSVPLTNHMETRKGGRPRKSIL